LAAHRVPPVLLGVVPQVTGGFGKPGEAADAFYVAEIEPLWMRLLEINEWLGAEAVRRLPYERQAAVAGRASPGA
jgi:capsid portal protein